MRISVDIGYGYTKAVSETGKELHFPSIVARKYASSLDGILGGNPEDFQITLSYPYDPSREPISYYVGNAAMTVGGTRNWEEEHTKNRNLEVLIATGIAAINEKEEPVQLAVGLPIGVFQSQNAELKKKLSGLKLRCDLSGVTKEIEVESVFVFPQGAGVYYAALHEIDGSIKNHNLINRQVAVVDVGYRTTDFLYMAKAQKGLFPRPEYSGSFDIGMVNAHQAVQAEAFNLVRGTPDLIEIEKALMWFQGKLEYRGTDYNLTKLKERAYENLATELISKLKQKWGEDVNHLSAVVIGGGGGDALYQYFAESFPNVVKVEKPEYANARGYLAAQALLKMAKG